MGPGQIRILRFLKENANPDGECFRYVQEIADAVALTHKYVTEVTSRFVRMGLISRKQTFDVFEDCAGTEAAYPDKNLYKILQPEMINAILATADERYYVNLARPEQLALPFPPHETTILVQRARMKDLFSPASKVSR